MIPIEEPEKSSGLVNRRAPNNWNTLLDDEKIDRDHYEEIPGSPSMKKDKDDLEGGFKRPASPNSFDDEEADALAANIVDSFQKAN